MKDYIASITVLLTLVSVSLSAQAEGYNITPGMWEMTYETKVTGGPPEMNAMMQQAPRVERECVKDNNYDFDEQDMEKGCKVTPKRHGDNKLTYEIVCTGEGGNAKGRGEVNFKGSTISGWSEMTIDNGPMGQMKIHDDFHGKRIGACD